VQADKAREDQHLLRVSLQASRQSEERAVAEAAMLARQLDGAHGELRKAKQVAADAALKSETVTQEITMIKDKAHADKVTLQAEFDEMRRATNDSITSASTATLVKEEMEAKLRNLMDGATVKEKELEVALFNSVHECAQVKKERQDSLDEMAEALVYQRKQFEEKMEQQADEFTRTTRELELRLSEIIAMKNEKDEEVDRLEKMSGEQSSESKKYQLSLTSTLSETKESVGRLSAQAEAAERELQGKRMENRMLKRESESALREAMQEREELEGRIVSLKTQLDRQAKMNETKLEYASEQATAQLALKQKEFEATLSMQKQEAKAILERTKDEAALELANLTESTNKKRRELESLLREANQMRKEQGEEIEFLQREIADRDEAAKKLASTTHYQIVSSEKGREREALEKELAQRTSMVTMEEATQMRRVLESALRESDAVARSLREELDQVRRDASMSVTEARKMLLAKDDQLQQTTKVLDTVSEQKEKVEIMSREQILAQSKVTERVQLELASTRRDMDRAQQRKAEAMEAAQKAAEERDMVLGDLTSTRSQLDTTVRNLDASDRRAQAIHREKLETVARLRSELVKERSEVEKVAHEKELTAIDLRRAAEEREMARKELATTMRLNKQLSVDKDEATLLSEGLKYRMSEVTAGQEQLLSGIAIGSPRYHPTGSKAANLSPRLHDPRPSSRYYA